MHLSCVIQLKLHNFKFKGRLDSRAQRVSFKKMNLQRWKKQAKHALSLFDDGKIEEYHKRREVLSEEALKWLCTQLGIDFLCPIHKVNRDDFAKSEDEIDEKEEETDESEDEKTENEHALHEAFNNFHLEQATILPIRKHLTMNSEHGYFMHDTFVCSSCSRWYFNDEMSICSGICETCYRNK